MSRHIQRSINSEVDASHAVLEATLFAREAGFEETPSRMIATAVSELVRNVLKYAGSGQLHMRQLHSDAGAGVEIEVRDSGPGILDCDAALEDHYSSGGTLGMGLPGVRRMMDEFELDSAPGSGTRVVARKWA